MAFCFPLDKLTLDLYDVVTWHLFLLLTQWCFVLPFCGKAIRHREMQSRFKHYLANDLKNLHERFFLQVQYAFPNMILQFINVFFRSLVFGHAREDFQVTHILAPFSLTHASFNTTLVFTALHLKSNGYIPLFLEDYDLKFSSDSFKLTFQSMPHLLANGLFKMGFEHLWNYFHLENSTSGFFQLFQLCSHFTQGHIPPRIARVFGVACLLTMIKLLSGIRPIIVGENIISTHKPHFMLSIPQHFCNTFFPTPI